MRKTRSNKKSVMKSINKSIKNVSSNVLPAVDKGLKTVGSTTTIVLFCVTTLIEFDSITNSFRQD